MAFLICSKCGTRLPSEGLQNCQQCARDVAELRLLAAALIVPLVLAVAVVVAGLPL